MLPFWIIHVYCALNEGRGPNPLQCILWLALAIGLKGVEGCIRVLREEHGAALALACCV